MNLNSLIKLTKKLFPGTVEIKEPPKQKQTTREKVSEAAQILALSKRYKKDNKKEDKNQLKLF